MIDSFGIGNIDPYKLANQLRHLREKSSSEEDFWNNLPQELAKQTSEFEEETKQNVYNHSNSIKHTISQNTKENEQRLLAILQTPNVGIAAIDNNGMIVMSNKICREMLGYTEEELLNLSSLDLTHPEDVAITMHNIDLVKNRQSDNFRLEKRYITKSGKEIWADLSVSGVWNQNNELEYMLGVIIDITDRKKIAIQNHNLLIAMDQSPSAIIITNLKGNIEYANPQFSKITGYEMIEIIGANLRKFKSGYHTKEFYRDLWNTVLSGKVWHGVFYNKRKNGTFFWEEANIAPVFNHQNAIINLVAVKQDITERIEIQKALRESEEKFKTYIMSSPTSIIIHNEGGDFTFANPAASELLGCSVENIMKHSILDATPPEYKSLVKENLTKLKTNGKISNLETVFLSSKKTQIPVIMDGIKISDNEFIAFIKDISQQKLAEEKLMAFAKELHDANESKDKFLSILSHDLKNPFNSILGFTDILAQRHKQMDHDRRDGIIHSLRNAARNAYTLLDNLLTWVRSQSGKMNMEITECNLRDTISEIQFLLQDNLTSKQIQIHNLIPSEMAVFADRNMLQTVMRNLMSNAIKFTPEQGEIQISAMLQNRFVEISVKDSGTGISSSALKNLFKIGETVSTEGTNGETGTGLGLLLCKDFVEMHGGTIWVANTSEYGSTFSFTLPAAASYS